MSLRTLPLIVAYLAAIVVANLITARFGPTASVYKAFGLIALDLITRDRLADFWGAARWRKMALLIGVGSLLSYLVNRDAGQIALASCAAFAAAEICEALLYWRLRNRQWIERANLAAWPAAAVDSLVFPTLAFGGVMFSVSAGQFFAKAAGCMLFSFLLRRYAPRRAIARA